MSNIKKLMMSAAGGGGTNVEELFSSYLYHGTGSSLTITNNIDLSTEGGLVWLKGRDFSDNHALYDTTRGVRNYIHSNTTGGQATAGGGQGLTNFTTSGFTVGSNVTSENNSGKDHVAFTFRKTPKFFDIVTWNGDSTGDRTISHNLDHTVGMMLVKQTNGTNDWNVYHRRMNNGTNDANYVAMLHSTTSAFTSDYWTYTHPTTSSFTVRSNLNISGRTYIAYLFAHNDGDGNFGPTGDQDIIKCGSYSGTGSEAEINVGFEPQWLLFKKTSGNGNWVIFNSMSGFTSRFDNRLFPNTTSFENSTENWLDPTATGFRTEISDTWNSGTYIYVAIRRGTAIPESASDVFDVSQNLSASGSTRWQPNNISNNTTTNSNAGFGFSPDMCIIKPSGSSKDHYVATRALGSGTFATNSNTAYSYNDAVHFNEAQNHVQVGAATDINSQVDLIGYQAWKRAPHFFDVVPYIGNGANPHIISHSLGVAPELIWIKSRDNARSWTSSLPTGSGNTSTTQRLLLNSTTGAVSQAYFPSQPTDTTFSIIADPDINANNENYVAYLFATLAGVSKVGIYTGTGSDINVDCGFSNGASWVMVKCSSHAGSWQMYNTAFGNGIASGNDSFTEMESAGGISSSQDRIDPYSAGFSVPAGAGGDMNLSGRTYIFYAIAA